MRKPYWLTEDKERDLLLNGIDFIACNKNGIWHGFKHNPPVKKGCYWIPFRNKVDVATPFIRLIYVQTRGYVDWENSLIKLKGDK